MFSAIGPMFNSVYSQVRGGSSNSYAPSQHPEGELAAALFKIIAKAENFQPTFDKMIEDLNELGSNVEKIINRSSQNFQSTMITLMVGTGCLAICNAGITIIQTYIIEKIKYMIGRPKMCREYKFETLSTRLYEKITRFVIGKIEKKPTDRPICDQETQEKINLIEESIKNTVQNKGYFSNLLLYGPPGTGKTMLSTYLAKEAGTNYIMISGGDFAQFIKRGEHLTELNLIFERMKHGSKPTILFIDEAECFAANRNTPSMGMDRIDILNTFLKHTGEASTNFMLILATNRPEDLDSAVLSRMDNKIYLGPPVESVRLEILQKNIVRFFKDDPFFTPELLVWLNTKWEGFSGRDIFKLCNKLFHASVGKKLTTELVVQITDEHIRNQRFIGQ